MYLKVPLTRLAHGLDVNCEKRGASNMTLVSLA